MPVNFLICPFCLSIYVLSYNQGDECPYCETAELENYDEYLMSWMTSFTPELESNHNESGTDS